ncbi:MAG: type II/IV secretion system ATPase subunit [Minisyncoccales bacterium]
MKKKRQDKNKIYKIESYKRPKIDFSPKTPKIPDIEDKSKTDIRYCVISPYTYIHIYWHPEEYELIYEVEEPLLEEREKKVLEKITYAFRNIIDFDIVVEQNQEKLLEYIDRRFKFLAVQFGIDMPYESYKKIYYYLIRDFVGFNEIEPLLRDYFVEDIECNGVGTPIYLVHRKFRNLKTNIVYESTDYLADFVEKISQKSGRYISYADPILDSSLPDGSRVNATYTKDISSRGPTFTIRKFTEIPWTPTQLVSFKTLSPEMLAYLWLLVQYQMNVLLAGGTASGKTTLLNAIAFFISPEARVVSIEDTRELNLLRENWLPSVTRGALGTKKGGEIDLFTLLRASFRQNPDYVIVGEVRGKEAFVLFQGMASGHSSISTIHADSIDTVIKRLETPPIELSPTLLNVLDCVCIMTHALVKNEETRKLRRITEVINVTEDGKAETNDPFIWQPSNDTFYFKKNSHILKKISERHGMPLQEIQQEHQRRVKLIHKLMQHEVFEFKQVQEVIHEYYKKPQEVLKKYGVQ